jgi:predicted RNA-binding protein YlxR (DUF448 family)
MKDKKIPMRKCVVTGERFEKQDLLRILRTPDGDVIYDKTGRANGRGAYLSKSVKAIEKAKKSKVLNRHLETEVPDSVFEELMKVIANE